MAGKRPLGGRPFATPYNNIRGQILFWVRAVPGLSLAIPLDVILRRDSELLSSDYVALNSM